MNKLENKTLKEHSYDLGYLIDLRIEQLVQKYHITFSYRDNYNLMDINPAVGTVLKKYNFHNNVFCNYLKTTEGHTNCMLSKEKLHSRLSKLGHPIYGKCYMGVEEFYFPVLINHNAVGVIFIGFFSSNIEKSLKCVNKGAVQCKADPEECRNRFLQTVRPLPEDISGLIDEVHIISLLIKQLYTDHISMSPEDILINDSFFHSTDKQIIKKALVYIKEHFNEKISVKQLASFCFCNPNYLSNVFRAETGMSIMEYINLIRINRAKSLLLMTEYSLEDITKMTGYSYTSYFMKQFKKIVGITPGDYRKRVEI